MTIREAADALRARRVSAVELAAAAIARISRLNSKLNAFITVTAEQAGEEARQADAELAAGRDRGPLHGIPVAVKDLFLTRGVRTTCGSRVYEDFVPAIDAAVVERLRAAGAVMFGKLNMHELAYGITSANPHFGPVRNPWNARAQPRRVERRLGRGGGRPDGLRRHGQRYGRLHPHPGGVLRRGGAQAHLWPREPLRRSAPGLQPGSHGPAGALGARCRHGAECHRRARPPRPHLVAPPGGRLRSRRRLLHSPPAHRFPREFLLRASRRRRRIVGSRSLRARPIAGRAW